ncbi:MAG TPA: polysaccharide deacetylase family protein [Candidatus Paceibacterota bacterium]|nr:polysaccharide deacetylase family protein [Candidatus Paceibacterota bacterium]
MNKLLGRTGAGFVIGIGAAATLLISGIAVAGGPNLISNPSLENNTSGWSTVHSGSNISVSFNYPVAGVGGGKAAKAQITKYKKSGDAYWESPAASVTAGKSYAFSGYSLSNIPVTVIAILTKNNGKSATQTLGTVPGTGSWQQFSATLTVPSGYTKVRFAHELAGVGYVDIDQYSLTEATSTPVPPPPPPVVQKPVINSFTTSSTTIAAGQSVTLSWNVSNASSTSIDQGVGTVTGTSKQVTPPQTTTYTLTATNPGGSATSSVTITVVPQTPPTPPTPPSGPNLIPNGNFEAGSTNNPTGWNADYWGNMTAKFAYPVAGVNGGKAAQVTVTNYKNGDADWNFDRIAVTAGQAYTFSDTYAATVDTEIDAQYKVLKADSVSGECSPDEDANYVDCAEVISSAVPSSSGFRTFSAVIAPPAGTVSMTVLHMLVGNGTLTVTNYSLSAGVAAGAAYPQGIVSLTFDDGYLDHYTNALPILSAAGMHGTFYMIPNDIALPEYMTVQQMLAMQTAGNDIASHTADHCDLVALFANPSSAKVTGAVGAPGVGCPDHALPAATTSQAEITNSKIQLQGMGISPDNNLAYPFGSYSSAVEAQVKSAGFLAARTIDVGYNTKATDPYALVVQNLDTTTSVATVEGWIHTALANHVWLILVFHQIEANPANDNDSYAETPAVLQGIVQYLAQQQACVLTVGQVVAGTSCL